MYYDDWLMGAVQRRLKRESLYWGFCSLARVMRKAPTN